MNSHELVLRQSDEHKDLYTNFKDPDIFQRLDGRYEMYVTMYGPGPLMIGHFIADHPGAEWHEQPRVRIIGMEDEGEVATYFDPDRRQICASTTIQRMQGDTTVWEMFIQTGCLVPDTTIKRAISLDGVHFYADKEPVISKETPTDDPNQPALVGVYDPGITANITWQGQTWDVMLYSGYRNRVANGDIWASLRRSGDEEATWLPPRRVLAQEEMEGYHNQPNSGQHEWGLEGAKLLQLGENQFLMIGVCFEPGDVFGKRQRVFFAAGRSPLGPFKPIGHPLPPIGCGENGHPDAVIMGDRVGLIYQERDGVVPGEHNTWKLRYKEYGMDELKLMVEQALGSGKDYRQALRERPAPVATLGCG